MQKNEALLPRFPVPGDESVHKGVDDHDDEDSIECVEQPVVNHLVVSSLGNHLVDR